MKQYKKSYELKNTAKDMLDGKYSPAMSVCLLSIIIQYIVTRSVERLNFLPSPVSSSGFSIPAYAVSTVFYLALNWIFGVMQLGTALFFLNVACGRPYKLMDLFYGYRNDSSRALVVSGANTLLVAAYQLPCEYLLIQFQLTGDQGFLYAASAVAIVGLCILLPVAAGISLSFYLLLDFPDKPAGEVLSLSFRVMNGHKRRWMYMTLSFLPLAFLCVCSLNVGFFWLIPYMRMTYACFFLDVMNPKGTA